MRPIMIRVGEIAAQVDLVVVESRGAYALLLGQDWLGIVQATANFIKKIC